MDPPATVSDPGMQDLLKIKYSTELEAWLEEWKQKAGAAAASLATARAREDTDRAAEADSLKAIHNAYIATTQSSLDRGLTRMNVLTGSVGAITTIYTGLLALVYAADTSKAKALTVSALFPALFLGTALFLVTIYAAVLRRSFRVGPLLPSGIGGRVAELRLINFMDWCFAGVLARSWALNAGVVSLGVGIGTLPVPFIVIRTPFAILIFATGLAAVLGTAIVSARSWRYVMLLSQRMAKKQRRRRTDQEIGVLVDLINVAVDKTSLASQQATELKAAIAAELRERAST